MPVEIRELVIRADIRAAKEDSEDTEMEDSSLGEESLNTKEAIIEECVRQVLRILRKEKER